ncbi:MAG: phosphoglucosamine mutase [Lentisphaeria bacterium]|nr:phosphoglucosamine mutase [Lentisphaeria bacterium]
MGKLFGTDGIRGKANVYPITPETALRVGKAIAHVFGTQGKTAPKVVIGKDTRLSGYMLETALTSGLVGMGASVLEIGPMPTPSVAHLTRSMCADCGIMITASHNPSSDNGIKIFSSDGYKLPDEIENKIEQYILASEKGNDLVGSDQIGKAYRIDDARGRYIEFAKSSIRNTSLRGIKAVLDCANGAAYSIAPLILRELGVEVITEAINPDGFNINADCGATHPENVAALVKKHGADIGISLDGDADRVIFCDDCGDVVNGDRIMGLCALDYKARGRLSSNAIAVTSMSNLGLLAAMKQAGINVEITQVGDRYVIERMREKNINLGGEQSGHLIFLDYATTGDGIISALHVLRLMKQKGRSLRDMADFMEEYPQKLASIPVKAKIPLADLPLLTSTMTEAEKALNGAGRINVRYSGTENKIRVLVEARSVSDVEYWQKKLTDAVNKELC